jgi:transposase-like protein
MPAKGCRKKSVIVKCPCGENFYACNSSILNGGGKYCSKKCLNKYRGDTIKGKDNLTGKKFGKLTVLQLSEKSKHNTRRWKCICECGTEKVIEGQSLKNGNTKSCGCLTPEIAQKLPVHRHGRNFVPIICGIYKVTNPKGEVYIGSSRTIYRRWLRHREANRKIKLHDSLREFGWRQHNFEIVHELPQDVTNEILLVYEQLYIDSYKDCGVAMLNVKEAGSSGKFPQESKEKMSASRKGKPTWNKGLIGGNKMAKKKI